jgi:hypothetical protein
MGVSNAQMSSLLPNLANWNAGHQNLGLFKT